MLTKKEKPILYFNIVYVALFGTYAVVSGNIEFVFYVSIVLLLILLVLLKNHRLRLSPGVLWALSAWGLLHMMGGNVPVDGSVLYNLQLIPVLLKYDQLVHAFGFGTTTFVGYQLLKPHLKDTFNWTTVCILLVMVGMGAGALNEILEFIATVIVPETNVGGYINTSLDMIFNTIGAIIAAIMIYTRHKKRVR
jgi:uncharacterized membrane protein YjdF